MTPDQIKLVQDSFRVVIAMREVAAAMFYERLFEIDPQLRALFPKTDIAKQGAKLMASLGFVVHRLDRPETILPALGALAVRHVTYGVEAHHEAIVGEALVDTLASGLGAAFTPELRAAWQAVCGLLSSTMIAATRRPAVAA